MGLPGAALLIWVSIDSLYVPGLTSPRASASDLSFSATGRRGAPNPGAMAEGGLDTRDVYAVCLDSASEDSRLFRAAICASLVPKTSRKATAIFYMAYVIVCRPATCFEGQRLREESATALPCQTHIFPRSIGPLRGDMGPQRPRPGHNILWPIEGPRRGHNIWQLLPSRRTDFGPREHAPTPHEGTRRLLTPTLALARHNSSL